MNRRSFLTSIGALILLPKINNPCILTNLTIDGHFEGIKCLKGWTFDRCHFKTPLAVSQFIDCTFIDCTADTYMIAFPPKSICSIIGCTFISNQAGILIEWQEGVKFYIKECSNARTQNNIEW